MAQLGRLVTVGVLMVLFMRKPQRLIAPRLLTTTVALTLWRILLMVLVLSVDKEARVRSIPLPVWVVYKTKNGGQYLTPNPSIATLKTRLLS